MIGVYERNSKLYIEVAPDSEAHEHGLAVGEHRIPSRRVICTHCTGVGVVAYQPTEADYNDPDLMADVGNGFYDTPCNDCDGEGALVEIDLTRLARNPALQDLVQAQGGW